MGGGQVQPGGSGPAGGGWVRSSQWQGGSGPAGRGGQVQLGGSGAAGGGQVQLGGVRSS